MDDNLYDEFGNYIGPELDEYDDNQTDNWNQFADNYEDDMNVGMHDTVPNSDELQNALVESRIKSSSVVLHEDRQHYPSAEEVYPGVEVLVQDEDTQALDCPILAPIGSTTISLSESSIPEATFDMNFLTALLDDGNFSRTVAVVGGLHHGKTSFIDLMIEETHPTLRNVESNSPLRYTDVRLDEREREISSKLCPISLVLPNLRGKSHLLTLIDAPGHPSFHCESELAIRAADGVILVVDVIEGVVEGTRRAISTLVRHGLPVVLVLNKVDRLILDLRLPVVDAVRKIKVVIEDVNTTLSEQGYSTARLVSPILNTVLFASTSHKWCFTLSSFIQLHSQQFDHKNMSANDKMMFLRKIWADSWYDKTTGKFSKKALFNEDGEELPRAFSYFIMEPLYKIYGTLLGADAPEIKSFFEKFGVHCTQKESAADVKTIVRTFFYRWFAGHPEHSSYLHSPGAACMDAISQAVQSPRDGTPSRLQTLYAGYKPSKYAELCQGLSQSTYVLADMIKNIPRPDASKFDSLVRVYSGSIKVGQTYHFLGPEYINPDPSNPGDICDDGLSTGEVTRIWILQGRYRIEVSRAPAGSLALIEYSGTKYKTATIVSTGSTFPDTSAVGALRNPFPINGAHVRVGVEPHNPAHLTRVMRALRMVSLCYPLVEIQVMNSGELAIFATSELEMDCVLRDIRTVYVNTDPGADGTAPTNENAPQGEVTIKVSDPSVRFSETVSSTSTSIANIRTENRENTLVALASPIPHEFLHDVSKFQGGSASSVIGSLKTTGVEYTGIRLDDIWCFGPDVTGPNILSNELSRFGAGASEKRALAHSLSDPLSEGFRWAMQKGPLCDEPVRGVKLALIDGTQFSSNPQLRSRRNIVPATRKLAYSAMLRSNMRLMEPVCEVDVLLNSDSMASAAQTMSNRRKNRENLQQSNDIDGVLAMQRILDGIFQHRRGTSVFAQPIAGTQLASFKYYVPLIETFGMETDLRAGSLGQAFVSSIFSHWDVVPGDPLDETIEITPLKIAVGDELARDFFLKTRRRKGLPDNISPEMYHQND